MTNIVEARNTLTQRTYGPACSGDVALEVSGMKNGDVTAAAFAKALWIRRSQDGRRNQIFGYGEDGK